MSEVRMSLPLSWSSVRQAREAAGKVLEQAPPALRDSVVMAVGELVENAVKYGAPLPASPSFEFTLTTEPSIVITVATGPGDASAQEELARRVQQIVEAPSHEALYLSRYQELLESPTSRGKLGLFRVAYEGGFALRCDAHANVVTVTATKESA